MSKIIFWAIFMGAYILVFAFRIGTEKTSHIIVFISGMLVLLERFFNALQKKSLRLYFLKLRLWHRFRNSKAKWWLAVRFDGDYSQTKVDEFRRFLETDLHNWRVKMKHFSDQSMNFIVGDSLNFYVDLTFGKHLDLSYDNVTIELSAIEVGYNNSVQKLNTEIIPLLEGFSQFFKPENQSYDFHIEFEKSNPFFALYINHLKPESVEDFHIHLHVHEYSNTEKADAVEIDKDRICVTTGSINALKELAKDFLLLSPTTKRLAGR